MGLVIGMDEAGYGPNLGPLVVTATAWDVPDPPRRVDFWSAFSDVAAQSANGEADCNDSHAKLHVADSKQVYTPARGLARLEQSVLALMGLLGERPAGFRELLQLLGDQAHLSDHGEPWLDERDVPLPLETFAGPIADFVDRLQACCDRCGVRLRGVASDVVLTRRFNRLTNAAGSKGVVLSRISMQVLKRVWNPDDRVHTFIVADKHGGRNRYDRLLDEILDGRMIFRGRESTALSSYRVGVAEIHFQTKAEAHFPVAVASMFSKYVRELAMHLFNDYWCSRIKGLKPTKGYPTDARRFYEAIREEQQLAGISDEVLWRQR